MKPLNKHFAPKSVMPEKVIQFGEGNFLRAFVDWIIWNMDQKTNFNGSVVVVQPIDKGMVDWLNGQDCLYHVNLQGRENGKPVNTLERIDVISRALNPYSQNDAFMALADQPEIRFVISNTTEAGIAFDPSCKLDDKPASSYPGKLVQLLYRRWQTFNGDPTKGLIIFPCELIFLNGHVLKECINKYIELWQLPADFKKWFDESCGVYATLVDRIVPGFPRKEIAEIQEKIGYRDNLVVQAENFHLWVIEAPKEIEKEFPADKAGLHVLFVPSEEPYHKRKVTLLNGPHTVLSPVAFLSGVNIVRDACNHEVIGKYIHKYQHHAQLIPQVPGSRPARCEDLFGAQGRTAQGPRLWSRSHHHLLQGWQARRRCGDYPQRRPEDHGSAQGTVGYWRHPEGYRRCTRC